MIPIYVAIAKTIDDISYNHTITYTHYSKLQKEEQSAKLKNIIHTNLDNLLEVFKIQSSKYQKK